MKYIYKLDYQITIYFIFKHNIYKFIVQHYTIEEWDKKLKEKIQGNFNKLYKLFNYHLFNHILELNIMDIYSKLPEEMINKGSQ